MTNDLRGNADMNGYVPTGEIIMNESGGGLVVEVLSGSKMSLQSIGSNGSSLGSEKILSNGHASIPVDEQYEEMLIVLTMGVNDRRFGFSVSGGIDQDHPPRVNKISFDSPATRAELKLNDEILEVNGCSVDNMTHADVIMNIHKCKHTITLKVRRYGDDDDVPFENRAIDVQRDGGEGVSQSSIDAPIQPGMLKYARTQPKLDNYNRESNIPAKYYNEAFELDERDSIIRDNNIPSKFVNEGYDSEKGGHWRLELVPSVSTESEPTQTAKTFPMASFITLLDVMSKKLDGPTFQNDLFHLHHLFSSSNFQSAVKTHNHMTKIQSAKRKMQIFKPIASNSQFLLTEVRLTIMEMKDPSAHALLDTINKLEFQELLNAHDEIAIRETSDIESDIDKSDSEGSEIDAEDGEETHYKIVRIDKTNQPLGATVRNEGDAVVISRIIKGGAAEKSGVLNEGDEILEINEESVRGKDVNDVVELLSELDGTLTFVLLPSILPPKPENREDSFVVKALFDYDCKVDDMLPCEELGLSFRKGDVLEILNQTDPDWWQARLLEEVNKSLAGLIPSKPYQLQREAAKITLKNDDKDPILKEKKKCFCGRAKKRKGNKRSKRTKRDMPFEEKEVLTYESMVKWSPDPDRKRPIVFIGPQDVGRVELRRRLLQQFPDSYALPVAHTTRLPTHDELSGIDFIFVSKPVFEKSLAAAEFIDHGHIDGHYYGTSFKAVKDVINNGKTCILNLHCSTLTILKNSFLLPYVIFITLPGINRVKQLRELDGTCEPFNPAVRLKEEELDELIEQAREMNRSYGHLFDKTIVNSDFDQTYDKVVELCTALEQEPQWVLASMLPGG